MMLLFSFAAVVVVAADVVVVVVPAVRHGRAGLRFHLRNHDGKE